MGPDSRHDSMEFPPLLGTTPDGPVTIPTVDLEGPDPSRSRKSRSTRRLVEWTVVLLVALVLAVGIRTYVAQMFYIPSGSMLPTLQIGERIVVDKLSYDFGTVHRGDIVVFSRPPLDDANYADLVKRVIGLPGETISSVAGRIYINGKPLAEPWLPKPNPVSDPSPLPDAFSLNHPFTIPAGEYYMMGDNRTDSEDSRWFGPIPKSLIVGKLAFEAWPIDPTVWLIGLMVAAVAIVGLLLRVLWDRPTSSASGPGPSPGPPQPEDLVHAGDRSLV